jgi:hypothetical protein
MESIEVLVDAEGVTKVTVNGVAGSGCDALTSAIEKSIGNVASDTKTGDYYKQATVQAAKAKQ